MREDHMAPAGLGSKIFVCRIEDLEKDPITPIQVIELKPHVGDIGFKEEPIGNEWSVPTNFTITGNATMISTVTEKDSWLKSLNCANTRLVVEPDERRLPRKMKKGFRAKYHRFTKWKHKAALWLTREQIELSGNLQIKGEELTFEGCKVKKN